MGAPERLSDALVVARQCFAQGSGALEALEEACKGDGKLAADALELLDGCTPHPWTFSLYVHGPRWVEVEKDEWVVVYDYRRTRPEVLAVMGKACVRAARMTQEDT